MRLERFPHVAEEGFRGTALNDRENVGSPLPIMTSPALMLLLLSYRRAIASRFVKFGPGILFCACKYLFRGPMSLARGMLIHRLL